MATTMTESPLSRARMVGPLLALLLVACHYDAPPQVSIEGIAGGLLADPTAPLVLVFDEPVVPASLRAKIVRYEVDAEGRLGDEDDDPATALDVIFDNPPDADIGGVGELDTARTRYRITLHQTLPVGPQFAVLIEPGLSDDAGHAWQARQQLKFGYDFSCGAAGEAKPSQFPSGKFFFVVDVDAPIGTQIQLWADVRVNAQTGEFVGQFTNGDRDQALDCTEYGLDCDATEVCRTLPEPACAKPSDNAGTPDEFPDFAPNFTPPRGYSFTVLGCVVDREDGSFSFANVPTDVVVQSPAVTVQGITLNSSWEYDQEGVLRGTGTFHATQVFLGVTPSGEGAGTHRERLVPDELAHPDIPPPPDDAPE
jgi:hypothetical protein